MRYANLTPIDVRPFRGQPHIFIRVTVYDQDNKVTNTTEKLKLPCSINQIVDRLTELHNLHHVNWQHNWLIEEMYAWFD